MHLNHHLDLQVLDLINVHFKLNELQDHHLNHHHHRFSFSRNHNFDRIVNRSFNHSQCFNRNHNSNYSHNSNHNFDHSSNRNSNYTNHTILPIVEFALHNLIIHFI